MTDDDRYDDEELAQARALTELIEPAPGASFLGAPARDPESTARVHDALDAAEMLIAARLPALSEARADAVFEVLQARIQSRRRRTRRNLVLLATGGSLAAAAALILAVLSPAAHEARVPAEPLAASPAEESPAEAPREAGGSAPGGLESAGATLRAAQLAWLDDPAPTTAASLELQLVQYRAAHFAALRRRYER